jgi:hypothetical protein
MKGLNRRSVAETARQPAFGSAGHAKAATTNTAASVAKLFCQTLPQVALSGLAAHNRNVKPPVSSLLLSGVLRPTNASMSIKEPAKGIPLNDRRVIAAFA